MSDYTLAAEVPMDFPSTVHLVREALVEQGFGVITEIDMSATLKAKLDIDLPPQLILGACRPQLAHQALLADPSIAAMLPCNVVVRSIDSASTAVEVLDPDLMARLTDAPAVHAVAQDAGDRLRIMLATISKED
ncbi:MAG: DUF302 domain-containing protein [Aeromicrobium sp.]